MEKQIMTNDIWEIQSVDGETRRAYLAFCEYRDLGRIRSIDAAYRSYSQIANTSKRAAGFFTRWAVEHDWRRRADAYDIHLEMRDRLAREAENAQEMADYRKRCKDTAVAAHNIGMLALSRAGVKLQEMKPEEITPNMIAGLLRAAAALLETSHNSEAEAIGVRALESLLDAHSEV